MELDLSSHGGESYLKKYLFNLKTHRSDGLILQVHHSYSDTVGESKRYRFIHCCFNEFGTHLAVADYKGNIFLIDLDMEKYWQLPHVGVPTIISFPSLRKHELLVSLDTTVIVFIHIETGCLTGTLRGHSFPATEVSYCDDGSYCLTSCAAEAILWDLCNHTQIHRLSLKQEISLKKVLFMPVTNHILGCFQDDTMNVWKFGSFECIKQIIPETWKTHHLKAIAMTKNGRAMVIGGHTPNLVIFCLDTWAVKKVVEFPESITGIKQMEFISQVFDGGANKILAMLTTSLEIYFFNIETSVFLKGMPLIFGLAAKFTVSSNGKYLASILTTGEVNIYIVEKIFLGTKTFADIHETSAALPKHSSNVLDSRTYSRRTQKSSESLSSIQKQIKEVLDVRKLLPILKQFGEYPETYRVIIWKTILQVPGNQESFISLSMKKCHPSYINLESQYPLVNKSLCNSLKKLLSNLSHWCPLFGEVDFLPEFVFPFVKFFHSDPLSAFEVVATVIVNWCQNWFEFFPFPPINMLSVLENILGHHDPDLLEYYLKNNITSSISVCPLFHTAFSEVLSKNEWLRLWDHILSNEPSFLFMAIVAYNVVCRNAIKSFKDPEELEKFFHQQNPIDMKMLISKTYSFLKETPNEIHSRQFFGPFRPLSSGGTYTTFSAYPRPIVDSSAKKLSSIRQEEEDILHEQMKALSLKKKLDKKLKCDKKAEDKKRIYRELEEKIRKTVEAEEDRILSQRQKLHNLRQELRMKELEILEDTRDRALKERLKRKEIQFERLLKDISKQRAREKVEVDVIEEEIRKYYTELLKRKCRLELELGLRSDEGEIGDTLEAYQQNLKKDLILLQNEWSSLTNSKRINIVSKMSAISDLINDVEQEVAREMVGTHSKDDYAYLEKLKRKAKGVECEIERLLNQLQQNVESKKSVSLDLSLGDISSDVDKSKTEKSDFTTVTEKKSSKGKTKTWRSISRKTSPGSRTNVRKITTVRSRRREPRVGKNNLKDTREDKEPKLKKISEKSLEDSELENALPLPSKQRNTKSKSKYSNHCRPISNSNLVANSSSITGFGKSENRSSDFDAEKRNLCHVHSSDCCKQKLNCSKFTSEPGEWVASSPQYPTVQGSSVTTSDSDDEILECALRTRKQLIEDAKRRQRLE